MTVRIVPPERLGLCPQGTLLGTMTLFLFLNSELDDVDDVDVDDRCVRSDATLLLLFLIF